MTTIVTRAGKGSPLTNTEVDTNFTNLNSAKLETLTSTDSSVTITGTGSTRDLSVPVNPNVVSGPASSTDNAIARYDDTTGKLIQNSTVTLDDTGNIANVNSLQFDTTPTAPTVAGSMFWDNGNGTPSVVLNSDVTLQMGQEQLCLVYNGTGSTISNGSVVAVSGAQGQRPSVSLADADSESLSANTLGIASQDIANGAEGFVTTFGLVRGINTNGLTAGGAIYLSSTAGGFTQTKPVAPAHTVLLGWVISVNASSGELFVNISNGWELNELHDVLITSPASGNTLIYDASAGLWKNANLTDGTGITITEGAGSITIANSGVLSVTGTSPVASSGGTTPAISLASGYGDTQNPYASKTAKYFLAAPNAANGVPSFRAIVASDIPTLNQNTTGSAATLTTGRTIGMTGDVTWTSSSFNGSANVTGTSTLATVNSNTGSFGSSSAVPVITVDGKGRITAVSTASITSGLSVTDDVATATSVYPAWTSNTSGTISGLSVSSTKLSLVPSTGTLTSAGNFVANSDERLKTNWRPVRPDFIYCLADLKSGIYDRVDNDLVQAGVSAQQLRKILPEAVESDEQGVLSVAYGNAALVAAVELAKEVVSLRAELAALKEKVNGN